MAAKRIASSSINWSAMAERVPPNQKQFYIALKARSDLYVRKVMANPETAPKIDFAAYKSKIAVPGMVDAFQKQYEALQVAYPTDKANLTAQIGTQEKEAEQGVKTFVQASQARIKEYQVQIAKWDDVLPFEEMTLEDFRDMFPEQAMDPLRRPTFWPHTPEEQLDYKKPDEVAAH